MKNKQALLAVLLVLALLICLVPATALAAGKDAEEPAAEETAETPAAEEAGEAEAEEAPEDEPEENADEENEAELVYVEEDDTYFSKIGETVYNNAGVVYSNDSLIYNNEGKVYANGGTVYNNAGVVYANGGTVYNNGGIVYNNGAQVYTFEGEVENSMIYGYYPFETEGDYSGLAVFDGLIEGLEPGSDALYISKDAVVTFTPAEGLSITEAKADAGMIEENEDGSYTLSGADSAVTLTLKFRTDAPELSLASGTYGEEQKLEITAPAGAEIYYTTDGSEPDEENGTRYDGALTLKNGCTVKAAAVVEGAELSEAVSADIAVLSFTAPSFEAVKLGYDRPDAEPIVIVNGGSVAGVIESVAIEGDEDGAFALNREAGSTVKAGATSEIWTIRPAAGLEKGSYRATVVFTLAGGETVELELSFRVK